MAWQGQNFVIGAIIGFGSSIGILFFRRFLDQLDQRKRINQLLSSIVKEVEEGIIRCQGLIKLMKKNNGIS